MKKMMVAACAMVAAFAAVADDALPPLKLAGFAICDKVDAEVCKVRGLSAPEKIVADKKGTVCYRCKTAAPTRSPCPSCRHCECSGGGNLIYFPL